MTIEIVSLPFNMAIFDSYENVYVNVDQRVTFSWRVSSCYFVSPTRPQELMVASRPLIGFFFAN